MQIAKRSRPLLLLAALLLPAAWVGAAALQETPAAPLTEEHALLKRMAGTWDAEVTMMGTKSKGSLEVKNAMNGLWNVVDYRGEFMGAPFHGHGVDGYDPEKGKYVSVWIDGMNPHLQVYEGEYDAAKDVLTYVGTGKDPMTGADVPETHRVTFHGEDAQTFEMIVPGPDGEDATLMTIEYKRRK